MARTSGIKEHMEVIGADGVHVGTIDKVEGDRIKLTKADSGQGSHQGHHHYLPAGMVAEVEGNKVRLSATAANAFMFEEEKDEGSARLVTSGRSTQSGTTGRSNDWQRKSSRDSGRNWTGIAAGAAAAAATAAGAAFLARKKMSGSDKIGLQTDENLLLISSAKVEGTPVVGRNGDRLGKIESFMVDKYTGRVAYAVLSFGGTFGLGESLFPLPWSLLTYDEKKDGYVLNLTKEQLDKAPKFKRSEAPEFDAQYRRDIAIAYRGTL